MSLLRKDDGNAMIEVALILPVLILLLLGVLDIGILLQQKMIVADSARVGAEYATTDTAAADTAGMQNAATNAAAGIPGYSATASVGCMCGPGGGAVSCTGTCPGYGTPAQYAQVTAKATLPLLFKLQALPGSISVQAAVKVRTAWTAGH